MVDIPDYLFNIANPVRLQKGLTFDDGEFSERQLEVYELIFDRENNKCWLHFPYQLLLENRKTDK
jgi:hypothetical protein